MELRAGSTIKALGAATVLSALAAGCAINDPLALDRAGDPQSLETIELVASEGDSAIMASFRSAVVDAFQRRGVGLAQGANAIVDLSISQRSAEISILPNEQAQEGGGDFVLRSPSRKGRWYEKCGAERLRATLAVFDRSSGELDYRASAQSDRCDGDDPRVADLAERLVADVMGEAPPAPAE